LAIPQPQNIEKLLLRCKKKKRGAQMELYKIYGPTMKAVCKRYLFDQNEVSSVLNQSFLVIFEKIDQYRFEGSFEGWMRKITVRQCLNQNQKKKPLWQELDEKHLALAEEEPLPIEDFDTIKKAIASLPFGFRTIFNLNEIEGYSHKEIAETLNISESTSRSQLARAKKILRQKLKHLAA
jgi:RNA polymerase sigma-70 factor (ECF subfamily)